MSYEKEKYLTNLENLKETLDEFGVAIIPDVLNKEEQKSMKDGGWDYLEHITSDFETPISRWNTKSWREYTKLYPKHSMLLQNCQVGQSQFVWDVRQNEKVINVFEKLWGTDDLLCSFDGVSFHFPPELTNRGWLKKLWYHTDQSFLTPEFKCIQSWVTAYDVNKGDATLSFLEKSHKHHEEFQKKFNIEDKSNWFRLEEEDQFKFYLDKGCEEKKIKCDAGSMVLWDSRTIHCGSEPIKGRKKMNMRNIVYICMQPRSLAKPNTLKRRIKAFEENRMSTHWPSENFKLFPIKPRLYPGNEYYEPKPLEKPKLTERGMKMIGY